MSSNTDLASQDDASFANLVQDIKLSSSHPSAVEAHIPAVIERLEAALTKLGQDGNDQESWDQVSNAFQFLADSAREEKARTPIGESRAVALLVQIEALNKQQQPHVDIQALRVLANICVDHEANRNKVLEAGAFETINNVLRSSTQPDAIKTACGALLNTTMACEAAQSRVIELDTIESLIKVLKSDDIDENEVSMTIAARVTANLCENDGGSQSVIKFSGINTVVHLLVRTSKDVERYMDLFDAATDILRAVASREAAQVAIQKEGLFIPLMDILEHTGISDEGKTEEEKKEDDKKFGETKAALVEVVVSATLADENMAPVFNNKEVMERFLTWLKLSDREDLQTCAALCLGNVARSDNHCVKLVHEYQAVEPLIHVVRKATDLKASHAATGVLRNLALAERNRELMGNAGVIQACFPLLKKDNALPLQANITLSSTDNTEGDIETPLSTLVDVIDRSDDFALKSEGTRTLCNLVKVIWGSEGMRGFDTGSIMTLQQTLNKADVVLPIAAMTRNPKYVVLQNEGVIALTLLVTSSTQDKNAVLDSLVSIELTPQPDPETTISEEPLDQTKSLTLLESLLSLIKNQDGKCPDEVRINVCVFLRNALDAATRVASGSESESGEGSAYLNFLKNSGIKDSLTEVLAQIDADETKKRPLVHAAILEVLSRLA
ncbi:hypothetical protein BGX24_000387 [Mortierella sp. AD032]|nr:hypothetical protein BGX24_000387 [Mortierella sp. AD032]